MMFKIAPIFVVLLASPLWAGQSTREKQIERVFRLERMITVHIRMTGEQWKMMQPEKASRLAVAMGVVQRPTTRQTLDAADRKPEDNSVPPAEGERRVPGLTGNEYAYVRATVDVEGQTIKDVGVRFKGQYSYTLSGTSPRRPLKLKFDHFVEDQRFEGIESMGLNTNALDPSQLRESLGYALFRKAGVAAPRTCLALVYLTVDGVYDHELLGIYTALEEIDKDFLRRHFDSAKGLLIRPERTRNLSYLGDRWEEYSRYNIQTDPTPFTAKRFMDFTRLIHHASDEEFCTEIGTFLDTDQFLRFLAANVLMVNLDSFLSNGHNFYIYVHPKTGKLTFVPWDLHLGFGWHGRTMEDWTGLTIERPYRDNNKLFDRIMGIGAMRDTYRRYLREFATGCFSPEKSHAKIDRLEQVIREAEEIACVQGKEFLVSMGSSSSPQLRAPLKAFMTERTKSVLDQLDGRVEGDPITGRPTPKHRPVPEAPRVVPPRKVAPPPKHVHAPPKVVVPPKPRPLPPNPVVQVLSRSIDTDRDGQFNREEIVDASRLLFIAHAWGHRGAVTETSLAETFERVQIMLNPYPAPVDDAQEPADPLRARPELTWAKAVLARLEGGKTGAALLESLTAAAGRMFDAADTDHNGLLNSTETSAFLDQMVPRQ